MLVLAAYRAGLPQKTEENTEVKRSDTATHNRKKKRAKAKAMGQKTQPSEWKTMKGVQKVEVIGELQEPASSPFGKGTPQQHATSSPFGQGLPEQLVASSPPEAAQTKWEVPPLREDPWRSNPPSDA